MDDPERRKKKDVKVDLMDASSMDRGSVKCINDARGLHLRCGKKVKNNVMMEPDGTISINSDTKLCSLTQPGRPSLSEIEYFMDYGEAYFEKPTSGGHGGKVGRLGGTKDYGDADFHKELVQPVSCQGVSTRASRLEKHGEKQVDDAVAPVAKKAKRKKKAAFSEDSMIVPLELRSDYAQNLSKELGHKVVRIKMDHNCLFRALAYLRDGNDLAHEEVRQLVCDELEADVGQRYSGSFTSGEGEFLNDVSYPAYVERMRHVNEWGGDLELTAFAFKFGLKIHVHHLFNATLVIQARRSEEEVSDEKDVHLAYYGDHYDVVSRMPDSSDSQFGKRIVHDDEEHEGGGGVDGTKKARIGLEWKERGESIHGGRRLSSKGSNNPPLNQLGSSRAHGLGLSRSRSSR